MKITALLPLLALPAGTLAAPSLSPGAGVANTNTLAERASDYGHGEVPGVCEDKLYGGGAV
ncbi:hypothetical protein VF21_03249 [Pseudogymnoascus sp. 05NY08]|nr:hypothetical protein VF21_03249 [Pseudogymnoascus sp. 05NY08]